MQIALTLGVLIVLIIIVIFIVSASAVGTVLIISFCVTKKKRIAQGLKPRLWLLILGIILLLPLASTVTLIAKKTISNKIIESGYENFVDEWKNPTSWITDTGAAHTAMEQFTEAADKGDTEALYKMFAENIRCSRLQSDLEQFIEEYPVGLSEADIQRLGGMSSMDDFYYSYEAEMDGKLYYIRMGATFESDDPTELGLEYFIVYSEDKENSLPDNLLDDTCVYADTK